MNDFILGKSEIMQEIMNRIQKIAELDIPVLLTGETGTGKSQLAYYIHSQSQRRNGLFLRLDCAQFSRSLIESELFGHEKGAFTGAVEKKAGLLELVCGGTLFLDEIENLEFDLQAKLLDVLESKTFRRVGGKEMLQTDFRLISATNVPINDLLQAGRLRKDFFYRLKGVAFHLPPLRERPEDIPLFMEYFLKKFNSEYVKQVRLSREAQQYIQAYAWPGNLREMSRTLEALIAATSTDSRLDCDDLPAEMQRYSLLLTAQAEQWTAEDLLREYVRQVMQRTGHNKTRAAKILGWSVNTLKRWLNKMG